MTLNTTTMHPTLIRANIALFKGERAEVLRLLAEYRAALQNMDDDEAEDEDRHLALWLDAQAQIEFTERVRRLQALVATAPPHNHYRQMAEAALHVEAHFAHVAAPPRGVSPAAQRNRRLMGLAGGVLTFLLIVFLVDMATQENPSPSIAVLLTPQSTHTPLPITPPPDRSRALVPETFIARYPSGILQVTALEDQAERVINRQEQVLVTPIDGARFYALQVRFECRISICDDPPQATLTLRLKSGDQVAPRLDYAVFNEPHLQPVALGRSSWGWVVFEIPVISGVDALIVTAAAPSAQTFTGQPAHVVQTIFLPEA